MDAIIRKLDARSEEHRRLELMAAILNYKSPNRYYYYVGVTYFDYGQDWKWTTILCDNGGAWGGYQALNPAEQEKIITGDVNSFMNVADEILADKYCPDRLKNIS